VEVQVEDYDAITQYFERFYQVEQSVLGLGRLFCSGGNSVLFSKFRVYLPGLYDSRNSVDHSAGQSIQVASSVRRNDDINGPGVPRGHPDWSGGAGALAVCPLQVCTLAAVFQNDLQSMNSRTTKRH
jgi:hypothetical protein